MDHVRNGFIDTAFGAFIFHCLQLAQTLTLELREHRRLQSSKVPLGKFGPTPKKHIGLKKGPRVELSVINPIMKCTYWQGGGIYDCAMKALYLSRLRRQYMPLVSPAYTSCVAIRVPLLWTATIGYGPSAM
uniref:Uncharacterized protein n=1 Tax=Hyaloperonospora arabidopsidis (strain Emoy2) TaxID=559515 RepID=M4BFR5_HYAAE